ncbi:MAG TPA: hypothetical protein VMW50_13585 [Dehalococcoidia bacterium]|nr:hypothetical protein [Dehalococcoidia bacterium]
MALAIAKRGRPYSVAEINFATDSEVKLRMRFYAACSDFHYREIMALSRALGMSSSTVENWKYKITFPSWYIAIQVIDWVKRGKPMREVPPWQSAVDMF